MTRRDAAVEVMPESPARPLRRRPRGRPPRPRVTLLLVVTAVVAVVAVVAGLAGGDVRPGSGPVATASPATTFEVYAHGEGQVAFARELAVGETFRLEHTHSVTRRPVVETFSVQDETTIAIEELWFDEPGPNLPAGPEPSGEGSTTFLREDGAFRVLHHGHAIGSLPLMVGSQDVDHQVVFEDGQRLRLLDVVRRGERVELAVGGARR
jgi:hypothetical protein